MSENNQIKVQTIPFSGKRNEYKMWADKFLCFCHMKGCDLMFLHDGLIKEKRPKLLRTPSKAKRVTTVFEDTDEEEQEAEKGDELGVDENKDDLDREALIIMNYKAYSFLMLAVTDPISYNAVSCSKTVLLPSGDARMAWLKLQSVYQQKTDATRYSLEQKFNKCELLNESKSPDVWFTELESIIMELSLYHQVVIDDKRMISQILYNMKAKLYETTLTYYKMSFNRNEHVDIEKLKGDLRLVHSQWRSSEGTRKKQSEVSMISGDVSKTRKFKKKFKGDCRICGKKGHKATECWENNKNSSNRPARYKVKNDQSHQNTGDMLCDYCGKTNHTEINCFKKRSDESKGKKKNNSEVAEVVMVAIEDIQEISKEIALFQNGGKIVQKFSHNCFIADSGSSSHMRYSLDGMSDLEPFIIEVKVGNSQVMKSEQRGTFRGTVVQNDNSIMNIVLKDVLYVPKLWVNLFSLTKAINNTSVDLGKTKSNLIKLMPRDNKPIVFDQVIETGNKKGRLLGVDIIPHETEQCMLTTCTPHHMHELLGHPNQGSVEATAKKLGVELKGDIITCESCAEGKAKVRNLPKSATVVEYKGGRIAFDTCPMSDVSFGGYKVWLIIQDEYTKYIWSYFLKERKDVAEQMIEWLNGETARGLKVEIFKCDNASENKTFQKVLREKKYPAKFEYTSSETPQQNGRVERKFATLFGKIRAMLNEAKVPSWLRRGLWVKAASVATKLENIIVKSSSEKTAAEKMYGKNPAWSKHLRKFGEIGIIKVGGSTMKIRAKLENRGVPAMFVDYPEDHPADCYQFWKLDNKQYVLCRNYTWLNRSYGDYKGITEIEVRPLPKYTEDDTQEIIIEEEDSYDEDNTSIEYDGTPEQIEDADRIFDEIDEEIGIHHDKNEEDEYYNELNDHNDIPYEEGDNDSEEDSSNASERTPIPLTPGRVSGVDREVYNLRDEWNPDPSQYIEHINTHIDENLNHVWEVALPNAPSPLSYNPAPITYRDAMKRKDKEKWQEAINLEFKNIEDKKVWKLFKKKDIPTGRKIIGNRWVFAIKDSGIFRARTVAKGFSQIPGKDHQENHAPVVHDTTLHLVLVIKLQYNLKKRQFDVETAFLYGDLEEQLYMEFPDGYEEYLKVERKIYARQSENCVLLLKALYGLVQAARQWWKKMTQVMLSIGFHPSLADPCLFVKKKRIGPPAFVILYVDDGGVIGTDEDIAEVMSALSKYFKIKDLGEMKSFVGCEIIERKNTIWLHQPKLIKHLKETFPDIITMTKQYKTPAAPKSVVIRPLEEDTKINLLKQTEYRSGVGMLLYLVKHSRPDLSNAVRELTKVLDGATEAHWKAMVRVIKYVFQTEQLALKLKPYDNQKGNLLAYSDSEFGGDRDTRISVYGYMIYYNGALISWKSKSGKTVTLSSTEAEYYACSETAKELIFIKSILESMNIFINLPMRIKVDNTGAIFLANNHTCGPRTKHIDIRTHFIRNYITEGTLKVEFVRTNDNDADINTKNTSEELFQSHTMKFLEEIPSEQIIARKENSKQKEKWKNQNNKKLNNNLVKNRKDLRRFKR